MRYRYCRMCSEEHDEQTMMLCEQTTLAFIINLLHYFLL